MTWCINRNRNVVKRQSVSFLIPDRCLTTYNWHQLAHLQTGAYTGVASVHDWDFCKVLQGSHVDKCSTHFLWLLLLPCNLWWATRGRRSKERQQHMTKKYPAPKRTAQEPKRLMHVLFSQHIYWCSDSSGHMWERMLPCAKLPPVFGHTMGCVDFGQAWWDQRWELIGNSKSFAARLKECRTMCMKCVWGQSETIWSEVLLWAIFIFLVKWTPKHVRGIHLHPYRTREAFGPTWPGPSWSTRQNSGPTTKPRVVWCPSWATASWRTCLGKSQVFDIKNVGSKSLTSCKK